jgi:hypothetical protein
MLTGVAIGWCFCLIAIYTGAFGEQAKTNVPPGFFMMMIPFILAGETLRLRAKVRA